MDWEGNKNRRRSKKQIGTISIDVFAADWGDDPAMSLISEIAS